MRLSTDIPGVTIVDHNNKSGKKGREEGEQGPGSPRTKVAYNFQGLRLEDAGTVARFELGFGGDGAFDDNDMMMDGNGNELVDREEDQQVSRKKVKVVKQKKRVEVPETPQHIGAGSTATLGRKRDEEGKFGIFIGEERIVDPVLEKAARGVVLSNSVDEMVFTGSGKVRIGFVDWEWEFERDIPVHKSTRGIKIEEEENWYTTINELLLKRGYGSRS